MIGEEEPVQILAFLLQHTHRHSDACLTDALQAPTLHFRKGIHATHDTPSDTLADNQITTRGCLAKVSAGLQRHIDRGVFEKRLILRPHRSEGVHLCMCLPTTDMIALTDNPVVTDNDRPHHRVRLCRIPAVSRQLQTAAHISLIYFFLILHNSCFLHPHAFCDTTKIRLPYCDTTKVRLSERNAKEKQIFFSFPNESIFDEV